MKFVKIIDGILDPKDNYLNYTKAILEIRESKKTHIPCIPILLQNIRTLDSKYEDCENGWMNWNKMRLLSQEIRTVSESFECNYSEEINMTVLKVHKKMTKKVRQTLLEIGKDFSAVGSVFPP